MNRIILLLAVTLIMLATAGCNSPGQLDQTTLTELTITDIHSAYANGDYSSHDMVAAYLSRIEQYNAETNALKVIGLGTDTGNSIRGPSSHCSLVGFRTTLGLISRSAIVPLYLRNDVVGPMCRTVEDATRVMEIVALKPTNGE
jgi:Asp-tRNA(Asn)/Glu-tRNA(Gln) amidotransferase A subunit family amidase